MLATLAMLLTFLLTMGWSAHRYVDARMQKPIPACDYYNTSRFPGHSWTPQERVNSEQGDGSGKSGEEDTSDKAQIASLEVSCQSAAVAIAGLAFNWYVLISALVAVVLAALAIIVPFLFSDARARSNRRNIGPVVVIDVDYCPASGGPAWRVINRGISDGVIDAVAIYPTAGQPPVAGLASANWQAVRLHLKTDEDKLIPHPLALRAIADDLVVAIRLSGSNGLVQHCWARFELDGTPARHRKKEDGRLL